MAQVTDETYDQQDELQPADPATQVLLNQYDRARDIRDKLHAKRREFFRAYMSYTKKTKEDGVKSDLYVPLIYAAVESFVPGMVKNNPKIEVWPREINDSVRAAQHRVLLAYDWDALNMPLLLINGVKSALIYGTAWFKIVHKRETRKRTVTVEREIPRYTNFFGFPMQIGSETVQEQVIQDVDYYNDPAAYLLDLDEVLPDPDGECEDSCEWIIHERKNVSLFELEHALKPDGTPLYDPNVLNQLKAGSDSNPVEEPLTERLETDREETFGAGQTATIDWNKRQYTVVERWTDEKVTVSIREFQHLPPIRNEYHEYGMKPFARYTPVPVPKEINGISIPQAGWSINIETNALHNARMDSLQMQTHQHFFIPRGSGINPRNMHIKPGGYTFTNGPTPEPLETKPLPPGTYRESDYLRRMGQDAMGATDTFRGLASQDTGGTATEASLLAQASASRAGLMFQILDQQCLNRIGRLFMRINELHFTRKMVRLTGEVPGLEQQGLRSQIQGGNTFVDISPEELASRHGLDLDLKISVAESQPETRQFLLKRSIEGLGVLGQIGLPFNDPIYESLLTQMMAGLGEDNPEAIAARGREIRERAAQAEQQQAAGPDGVQNQAQQLSADRADGGQGNVAR